MSILSAVTPRSFRRRIDDYIATRNPPAHGVIELHSRRLYILPTRFGYLYAFMLVVLLLAAINYQNSMAFALTFLLTAIGIVSLWQTHKNVVGIQVELKAPQAVFCGENLTLEFHLDNPQQNARYALGIQYAVRNPTYAGVAAEASASLFLELPTVRRGQYHAGAFTLFSRYPTGLFHAWGFLRFDTPMQVYPQPQFDVQLRQRLIDDQSGKSSVDIADGDDFAGLREHRQGESLRHISWKAFAQGRGMLTKTFQGHATPSLWISWDDMSAATTEAKLSQMTALVILANREGRIYGLILPTQRIEQDSGPAHYTHCLHSLATYQQADVNAELPIDES